MPDADTTNTSTPGPLKIVKPRVASPDDRCCRTIKRLALPKAIRSEIKSYTNKNTKGGVRTIPHDRFLTVSKGTRVAPS